MYAAAFRSHTVTMASQRRQSRFVTSLARQVAQDVTLNAAGALFEPAVMLLPPGALRSALLARVEEHRAAFLAAVRESR